jgi:hypothetical protein
MLTGMLWIGEGGEQAGMPVHEPAMRGQLSARPDNRARQLRPPRGGHGERTYFMFIGIGTIVVIVIIVLVVLVLRR